MAKRKSDMEDMIELAAKIPWWLNIILAVVSYVALHHYATRPNAPTPTEMSQMGDHVVASILQSLAIFGQYLLPFIFILAAVISLIKQARKKK